MSNKITLGLVHVTPTTQAETPGFILKLQAKNHNVVETAFGTKEQDSQLTYYMKVKQVSPGIKLAKDPGSNKMLPTTPFSAELDLDEFDITPRDFTIEDTTSPDNGKTVELKWLQLKAK